MTFKSRAQSLSHQVDDFQLDLKSAISLRSLVKNVRQLFSSLIVDNLAISPLDNKQGLAHNE